VRRKDDVLSTPAWVVEQRAGLTWRILLLCMRQRLSLTQLARKAGLPKRSVQILCSERSRSPSVWTVAAVAQALGVSVDYLVLGLREDRETTGSLGRVAVCRQPLQSRVRSRRQAEGL
jgi:transcriptional regulator with XRE-family HTH domain